MKTFWWFALSISTLFCFICISHTTAQVIPVVEGAVNSPNRLDSLLLPFTAGLVTAFPAASVKGSLQLRDDVLYQAEASELFRFNPAFPDFHIVQGGYFDGNHFYVAMVMNNSGKEITRIQVLNTKGETVGCSEPLELDHANNIAYHPGLHQFIVSHCQSDDGHYSRYSMVDITTLTITKTEDKPFPFFSMTYSPKRNQYASGRWSGGTLDIWDGDMNPLHTYQVAEPASMSQGVCCDESYIYFVRSSHNGHSSEILVYDWEGTLIHEIPLMLPGSLEPENINIVNGKAYILANGPGLAYGAAYVLTLRAR